MDTKIIMLITILGLIIPNKSDQVAASYDTSFEKVLNDWSVFIDKTLFVKTLFDKETPAKILIRAPHGFGKSTNLDMVKRFLEINTHKYNSNQSSSAYTKKTQNFNLFTTRNQLKIFKYQKLVDKHFGKYPVIFIDYNPLCSDDATTSYSSMLTTVETILNNIFAQHMYLLESSKLWVSSQSNKATTQEEFNKFVGWPQKNKLSETDIINGFILLAQLIFKEFGKPIFVLIDDFDAYMDNLNFTTNTDADRIVAFIQLITGELLKCNCVDRALLMGAHHQANSRNLPYHMDNSTVNNIIEYRFLDEHTFNEYHGITETEFNKLLHRNIDQKEEIILTKDLVQEHVPCHIVRKDIKLYTTFPIVNFLRHRTRTGFRLVSSDF